MRCSKILLAVALMAALNANASYADIFTPNVYAAEMGAEAHKNVAGIERLETVSSYLKEIEKNEELRCAKREGRLIYLDHKGTLEDNYLAAKVYFINSIGRYVFVYNTDSNYSLGKARLFAEYGKNIHTQEQIEADLPDSDLSVKTEEATDPNWDTAMLGMETLKKSTYNGYLDSKVMIAVIDTGIDTESSLFNGIAISDKSYSFVRNSADVMDLQGHGTHVSGIIAKCMPAGKAELMVLQVFNEYGQADNTDIFNAVLYACENGADIINMSLGFEGYASRGMDFLDKALEQAREQGIITVCAAGNTQTTTVNSYPARLETTYAVSSIGSDQTFSYEYEVGGSDYGEAVCFCAPGEAIVSAGLEGEKSVRTGTSMSAPFISAAFGYIHLIMPETSLTDKVSKLISYCIDLGEPGKDPYYGYGCPDLSALYRDTCSSTGHEMTSYNILKEAGCEEEGEKEGVCQRCAEKISEKIRPNGHTYDKGTVIKEATYTSAGTLRYLCKNCSNAKEEEIPKLIPKKNSITANNITVTQKLKKQKVMLDAASKGGTLTFKSNVSGVTVSQDGTILIKGGYIGKAIITITASSKNNEYSTVSKKISITVKPKKTEIEYLGKKTGSSAKLKWTSNDFSDGYQIRYKRKAGSYKYVLVKDKKSTTKTIKGLKKGTYYFSVRTYKNSNGKRLYGDFGLSKKIIFR